MSEELMKKKESFFHSLTKHFTAIIGIILLIAIGIGGFFFYRYITLRNNPASAQKAANEEIKKIITKVGKIMMLPNDEIPTVAIVTDASKLKDQPFFKNAKNGDKVLIFAKSKKAILYSESSNKIIDTEPVTIGSQPNQSTQAKISLRNGTEVIGLAAKEANDIQNTFPGANIVSKTQAARSNFTKTQVIVLNPLAKDAANVMANYYHVVTSYDLPVGETRPDGVDILIILGKDRG